MTYHLLRALGRRISRCSGSTLNRLAHGIGIFLFDVIRLRRRVMLKNLTIALGDELSPEARVRMARRSMQHFVLTILEFLEAGEREITAGVEARGQHHFEEALRAKQGAYIVCAHLGNWEAMGPSGSRFVAPTRGIVKEVGEGGANQLVDEFRRKNGLEPIYRKPEGTALKSIYKALGNNELVAFMLDQSRPGAPEIPFFGHPAKTLTSLAAIWRKTPRPVIPVSIQRIAPRRHIVTAWPALDLEKTDQAKEDVVRLTGQFNIALETMIRTCPEQYFWLHNRWKSTALK